MGVDEAGQDQITAMVDHLRLRMGATEIVGFTRCGNDPVTDQNTAARGMAQPVGPGIVRVCIIEQALPKDQAIWHL
jgi:hypothetical protein